MLLHWLRGAVFFPFQPPHHDEGGRPRRRRAWSRSPLAGFWGRVADAGRPQARPDPLGQLLALTPFAILGARTEPNYSQLTDLSPDQPSIVGAEMVRRYFAAGELGPATVLVEHPRLDFRSEAGRAGDRRASSQTLAGAAERRRGPLDLAAPGQAVRPKASLQRARC